MRLVPATLAAFCLLSFSAISHAEKPASRRAAAVSPQAVPTLAHNLDAVAAERLQLVVDKYAQETGKTIRLIRLERGDKPATLNLLSRHHGEDVLAQPGHFMPLHAMMSRAGRPLSLNLSEVLRPGMTDARGRLLALPVMYSTPVLFYNKNAFRRAGLDPERPPRTWFEMQGQLDRLQSAGYSCPYASSWPVWVHIDNVSAISGVPAADARKGLGFNALPQVKHVAMMATWSKANYFRHFGSGNEASERFRSGECAVVSADAREFVDFHAERGFELGVAPLPFHDDVYGGRQAALADGPAVWVGAGKSAAEYRAAADFVTFLASPAMQVEIVRLYGGLPMTDAARRAASERLLQGGQQALDAAYQSLQGRRDAVVRVANIDPARRIADEELQAVWSNAKPAKAGLDMAVERGNALLSARPELKRGQPF